MDCDPLSTMQRRAQQYPLNTGTAQHFQGPYCALLELLLGPVSATRSLVAQLHLVGAHTAAALPKGQGARDGHHSAKRREATRG